MNAARVSVQVLFWSLVMAVVGVFSRWPGHAAVPEGHGELRLSMARLTERMQPCRRLDEAERAALAPNMRVHEVCERERAPALLELRLDEALLLREEIRPAGFHRDGRVYLYRAWPLPAGVHELHFAVRHSPRGSGYDATGRFAFELTPGASALLAVSDEEVRLSAGGTRASLAGSAVHGSPAP